MLHVPATGDREDPTPMCPTTGPSDVTWIAKPVAAYPPGYRRPCKKCSAQVEAGAEIPTDS